MRLAIAAPANTLLKQEGLKPRKTIVFVKKLVDSLVSTFAYRNLTVLHWEIFRIFFLPMDFVIALIGIGDLVHRCAKYVQSYGCDSSTNEQGRQ